LIGIGSAEIYIDIPSLPREELEIYSRELFTQWENHVDTYLELSDYSLSISVEDGSVKALGKIAVGLYALYIGIGQYGSFISGLKTIKDQVSEASDYFGKEAVAPFEKHNSAPSFKKRGEVLAKLEGIIKKVESGKLTAEEALEQSKALLGQENDVPEFYSELEASLTSIPSHPSEQQLEFDIPRPESEALPVKPRSKSPSSPIPKQPPIEHYRVIVWRESREKDINVTVSKI
jgi:hypothetical protein